MEHNNRTPPLMYALVARGAPPVVLAEYAAALSGNLSSIAYRCLQNLPSSNNTFTYNYSNHTFNYLLHDAFTYCVVAQESAGRQIPLACLERIKDDFVTKYGGGKAAMLPEYGLSKQYGPKLKEHMQYCTDHPEEISQLAKLKAQVSEIKGVMMENIDKILDRGERIEVLMDKTENLHHQVHSLFLFYDNPLAYITIFVGTQAQGFRATGTSHHRKMWLQNIKIKLIVLAILIALIIIIVISACKGFNCGK